jgi:hypothetical protein
MSAIGGDDELALAASPDAVQLRQPLHTVLAHAEASGDQIFPHARPAVLTLDLGVDGPDARPQRLVAQSSVAFLLIFRAPWLTLLAQL